MDESEQPNIILIVLDTVRAHNLELYGHERETMPRLARFANDATVFERGYTNSPWTLPAHASLFTGLRPSIHGCHGGSLVFDPDDMTMVEQLSAVGYETYGISNNIWISDHFGFDRGFDIFQKQWQLFQEARDIGHLVKGTLNPKDILSSLVTGNPFVNLLNGIYGKWFYRRSDFGAARTTDDAIEIISQASEPFFLFLNYMEAHAPYQVHKSTEQLFEETPERSLDHYSSLSSKSFDYHTDGINISQNDFKWMEMLYDGELRYLDDKLGHLFDTLRRRNILGETLVIVVGDHGENIGDHGLMAHRFSVHDTLLHVPLIVRYPYPFVTDAEVSTPIDFRDIHREITGVAAGSPPSLPGLNEREVPVIAEYLDTSYTPEQQDETFAFNGSRFDRRYAAVIDGERKYIRDDRGYAKLYEKEGFDFEVDGRRIGDCSELDPGYERYVNDFTEIVTSSKPIENKRVKQHLNDLGYI